MEQINVFHKGIVSDLDYSKRDNLTWDFPTENIRVINKEGQGLVVTNMDGNEELFEVSEGFYILGARDFNGIIYIASHNPAPAGGGAPQSEIGCYPSPVAFNTSNTAFERVYKPLNNFNNTPFTTDLFNFSMYHAIDMLIKQSYDDSVDIYLCDGLNPNRVVNSGFKRSGEINQRGYTADHFDGSLNHVPATLSIPMVEMTTVEGGGTLKPGTYFAFIRYCTQDFARTHFLDVSGPIVVYENYTPNEVRGVQEKDWLSNIEQRTNKKFTLEISNLDATHKYFEIALLRYSADNENGPAVAHYSLIDKRFLILGETQYVVVTGLEQYLIIDRIEISKERIPYDLSKTIDEVADRYIGSNWKMRNEQYDIAKFAELASMITLDDFYSDALFGTPPGHTHWSHNGNYATLYGMLDYSNASNAVGYFRGQIYPFAIQFIFNDNTVTDAFPVRGNITDPDTSDLNIKGVFKFGEWVTGDKTDRDKTLGIRFDFDGADEYFQAYISTVFKNIIGFRLLRGDRVDNLIGQGILLPAYDRLYYLTTEYGINNSTGYDEDSAYSMPLIYGALPFRTFVNSSDIIKITYTHALQQFKTSPGAGSAWEYWWDDGDEMLFMQRNLKKFGLFMPDLFFEQNSEIPSDIYIEPVVKVSAEDDTDHPYYSYSPFEYHPRYCRGIIPLSDVVAGSMHGRIFPIVGGYQHCANVFDIDPLPSYNEYDLGYYHNANPVFITAKAAIIDRFVHKGALNMKSWLKPDDIKTKLEDKDDKISSRSYVLSRYIGISVNATDQDLEDAIYGIVNIYKNENNDNFAEEVVRGMSVASQLYRPISPFYDMPNTMAVLTKDCFQGDCYYHKTWFRHGRWFTYENANVNHIDGDGNLHTIDYEGDGKDFVDWRTSEQRCWQYGALIGIITENKHNTAARNNVSAYDNNNQRVDMTYFPKCLADFSSWVYWTVLRDRAENEAFQINNGYHQPLTEKYIPGYDSALITSVEYKKTNRIYYSERHVLGAFIDGWRDIKPSYFKDFTPQHGEIIATRALGNYLISIMENAIIRHFFDDKEMKTDDAGKRVILGTSVDFLSDNFVQIASYGSLHKHGMVRGDNALYGVDMKRKILWMVTPMVTQSGQMIVIAKDLSQEKSIMSEMERLGDCYIPWAEFGPVGGGIPDEIDSPGFTPTTLYGTGLSAGYNKKYKEVYFTFAWRNTIGDGCMDRTDVTLVYSELLQAFIGKAPFSSMMYMNLDADFLAAKYELSSNNLLLPTNKVMLYDVKGKRQEFDGEVKPMYLTFIVNGLTGERSLSNFEKIFEALAIVMNKVKLTSITYETEGQTATYTFKTTGDDDNFWEHAAYIENKWNLPIIPQASTKTVDYEKDSNIRGKYMKVTIAYVPSEEAEEIIIRSIATMFNISIA